MSKNGQHYEEIIWYTYPKITLWRDRACTVVLFTSISGQKGGSFAGTVADKINLAPDAANRTSHNKWYTSWNINQIYSIVQGSYFNSTLPIYL